MLYAFIYLYQMTILFSIFIIQKCIDKFVAKYLKSKYFKSFTKLRNRERMDREFKSGLGKFTIGLVQLSYSIHIVSNLGQNFYYV